MNVLNMDKFEIQELESHELLETQGGIIIEAIGLGLAIVAFGYTIGKDLAEADRRNK